MLLVWRRIWRGKMSRTVDFAKKINDRQFYLKMYKSEECLCERQKKAGFSFCYRCYKALPKDMQRALYQRMRDGYEEAFDEACQWLQTEVW
jgi:hypothetical protein